MKGLWKSFVDLRVAYDSFSLATTSAKFWVKKQEMAVLGKSFKK